MIAAWGPEEKGFKPTPEELIAAEKEGLVYKKVTENITEDGKPVQGYQLGRNLQVPTFKLLPSAVAKARLVILGNHDLVKGLGDEAAADRLITVLATGFTIQGKLKDPAPATKTHLILRSFSRSLEAAASEQNGFAALLKDNGFAASLPDLEKRPILTTRFTSGQRVEPPLVKLFYMGKFYQITDEVNSNGADITRTWNRDVYRLLMALSAQVTVDISKFQRQVIELQQ